MSENQEGLCSENGLKFKPPRDSLIFLLDQMSGVAQWRKCHALTFERVYLRVL